MSFPSEVPFTLSLHFYPDFSTENHLDLFLDMKQKTGLIHYKVRLNELKDHRRSSSKEKIINLSLGRPHRKVYLKFQGDVSQNRGRIRILKQGKLRISSLFDPESPQKLIQLAYNRRPGRSAHSFTLKA